MRSTEADKSGSSIGALDPRPPRERLSFERTSKGWRQNGRRTRVAAVIVETKWGRISISEAGDDIDVSILGAANLQAA